MVHLAQYDISKFYIRCLFWGMFNIRIWQEIMWTTRKPSWISSWSLLDKDSKFILEWQQTISFPMTCFTLHSKFTKFRSTGHSDCIYSGQVIDGDCDLQLFYSNWLWNNIAASQKLKCVVRNGTASDHPALSSNTHIIL